MIDINLTNKERKINLSVPQTTLNDLIETTTKASALAEIMLCADFWTCANHTQYNCIWLLSDLITQVRNLCEQFESSPIS